MCLTYKIQFTFYTLKHIPESYMTYEMYLMLCCFGDRPSLKLAFTEQIIQCNIFHSFLINKMSFHPCIYIAFQFLQSSFK